MITGSFSSDLIWPSVYSIFEHLEVCTSAENQDCQAQTSPPLCSQRDQQSLSGISSETDASISWKRVEVGLFSCFLWALNSTSQKNLVASNYVVQGCELSKEVIFLSGRSKLLAITQILLPTIYWLNDFSSCMPWLLYPTGLTHHKNVDPGVPLVDLLFLCKL